MDPPPNLGKPVLAGGAVVTREHPTRGIEVVVIHRQRYGDWTLPKGKIEPGEALPVCAVREVREETGVTIRLGVPLDTIRYEAGKAGLKKVDSRQADTASTRRTSSSQPRVCSPGS